MTEKTLNQRHSDLEAIFHFKQSVADGKNWYIALLEAISLWGSAEETHNGQFYRYLIWGEAFDWLSLAQRLCLEVDGLLPEEEKEALLFSGIPPIDLSQQDFRALIGEAKYRAYLNYVYGIVVEEALVAAVAEEVHRDIGSLAINHPDKIEREAYRRVYDSEFEVLLGRFFADSGRRAPETISLIEEKEFTYWLFKRRVDACEKARVASDTKKALEWLQRQWASLARKRGQAVSRKTHRETHG